MPNPVIDILIPHRLSELQIQAIHVWLATISSWLERRRPYARRNQKHHDHMRDRRELLQLRLQLWQDEISDPNLKQELTSLQDTIRARVHHYWHVGITDGTQLDVSYPITSAVRPFSVDLQAFEPTDWDDDRTTTRELDYLIAAIGGLPKYRIQLLGFLEGPEDYLLCGYMASELARECNGFARVVLRPLFHTIRGEAEWTQADSEQLARSLGGEAHEICLSYPPHETYRLLDSTAMREWTRHPRFHLHG